MRVLFIHLSDIHLKDDGKSQDIKISAITHTLNKFNSFNECVLIISGDIANAGKKGEFSIARKFIINLVKDVHTKYLRQKQVDVFIVPGNHDNLANNINRNNLDINEDYKKNIKSIFSQDLEQLNNFYDFSNEFDCFKKNRVIDVKSKIYGNIKMRFNLINTAPLSLLGSGNEDKGLHFLPPADLDRLNENKEENYTISIMHHSPEWFSDESKQALYKSLNKYTDLLFVGHEHFSLSENKVVNGDKIDVSSGLALNGTTTEQGFNILLLDIDCNNIVSKKFIYKDREYKFMEENLYNGNVVFHNKFRYNFSDEFKKIILADIDERVEENYNDYFVFPTLEATDYDTEVGKYVIPNEEKFMKIFQKKKEICIAGSSKSGKTILSKFLCNYLSQEYVPIYIYEDNIYKNPDKMLKSIIDNQYGKTVDIDDFFIVPKENLVLIIDDYDKVNTEYMQRFINKYKDYFGHIIKFLNSKWNLNIKEKTVEELTGVEKCDLTITPFYYQKREKLIRKIYEFIKPDARNFGIDINNKVRKINEEITRQIKYFQLTPEFIHQFVRYYISFSHIKSQTDTNVFNKVYEANITFKISTNVNNETDIDEILVALDYVAHYIHFNKKYPLPLEDFKIAVNEYKNCYDNNELNIKYVRDVALKSHILQEENDCGLEFVNNNLLAYFVAQHLNRTYNEGTIVNDLNYVLDNVCFGINGDVLLFLTYITSNVQILNPILSSTIAHMKKWDELNIDKENIKYLSSLSIKLRTNIPNARDKKKLKEERDKVEKEVMERQPNAADSLYSYDEGKVNSFNNKISKSITYLDLVAKILPNFRHIIRGNEKKEIINILYAYPNKLLYFMLKDIDDNREKIIEEILKEEPRTREGSLVTRAMIENALQNQSIIYILSIYDFVSNISVNDKTILELEKFDYRQNTNYLLQNLIMQEKIDDFDVFSKKAMNVYKNAKIDIAKRIVELIVRKYFLYHDVDLHGKSTSLVDLFFGKNKRKNIQIIQAKNRTLRK